MGQVVTRRIYSETNDVDHRMEDTPLGQQPTDVLLPKQTVKIAEENRPIFTTKNLKGPCLAFVYPHFKK
jgi:hypothetical protein